MQSLSSDLKAIKMNPMILIVQFTNYDKNDISYERIPLNKNYDKVVKEDLKHDFDLDGSKK